MRRVLLAGMAVVLGVAMGLRAEEEEVGGVGVGVTAKIGTLGYGGDLTLGLGRYLAVRGGYNQVSFDRDVSLDEADITGELDWQTIPILLDVHPFGGGFRLSAGYVRNNNEIRLTAFPGEVLELDGTDYEVQRLDGKLSFDANSYYAGFGYGNAASKDSRWHFSCDFGIMYHGEPEIEATATATDPGFQEALNHALNSKLDDYREDTKDIRYYPVISVGVSFRL
jgi:hypothetical protein